MKRTLSFDDVLLVPQSSGIKSRSEVNLARQIPGHKFSLPIMSSPMDTVTEIDVKHEGAFIRNSSDYFEDGINVNFVQLIKNELFIRTYERGVEDETLSCGTGAIASAISAYESGLLNSDRIKVNVLGGQLEVLFSKVGSKYSNIHLIDPTKFVFNGEFDV